MEKNKYIIICLLLCLSASNVFAQEGKRKEEKVLKEQAGFAYSVSGIVRSADTNKPLPGISITLPNKSAAMTGDDGSYTIKLPSLEVILFVTGPGYAQQEVSVRGRTTLDIYVYNDEFKSIFENIETPYGELTQTRQANAWNGVTKDNILSTATTADALLQGNVPGLNAIYRSGMPGNGANMYLRGFNTMNAGSQPLYIVDGMPYENSAYSSSLIGNYYTNPLSQIDIKDIETITVMKDGTSMYGVKGSNGVVLIRTLRPKAMQTKINVHMHTGVNFESDRISVLNPFEHKSLLSDLNQSAGMNPSQIQKLPYFNNELPKKESWGYSGNVDYYRYNQNTNWQKDLYKSSFNQNYYMNVAGGDNIAVYSLSVGYLNQEGSMKDTKFERFNTRFNTQVNMTNKFTMLANMSFVYTTRNLHDEGPYTHTNPMYASMVKAPFMAANVYNESGLVSPQIEKADIFGNSNPYALIKESEEENISTRFTGNFEGKYKFNNNVTAGVIFGLTFNKEREKIYFPLKGVAYDTLSLGLVKNEMKHRVSKLFTIYTEGYATYNKTFSHDHHFIARVGARFQSNKAEDDWGKGYNSSSDKFTSIQFGDPLLRQVGGSIGNWNWFSMYGTADYSLKNRYFFNYTMAADHSTRFGEDASDILVYPSVSAAWLISGEDFLKNIDFIDLWKLRVSYGMSANDDIGNYSGIQYYVPQNILGGYGLIKGNLVDKKLKPEHTNKLNLGMDLSFLKQRVNLSLDVYYNKVKDMILKKDVPRTTGFKYCYANAGSMENKGLDLSLNARIINTSDFKWDFGVVLSTYKNKITNLVGKDYITDIAGAQVLSRKGNPVGLFYGYKTKGVYATQNEANAAGLGVMNGLVRVPFAAGDMRFVDQDGDKLIDENDRVIIGDPNPDIFGSISSTFKYKRLALDVFMTYSVGNDVYNYTRASLESMSSFNNQTKAVRNRWKVEGDITGMPRAAFGDPMGNARFSDRWIENGSYLRLKNVTLNYRIPLKNFFIRNCTVFVTGENLVTFTKYKGLDPEFSLGQSPLYNGIDGTFMPQPQTVSIGIKMEL